MNQESVNSAVYNYHETILTYGLNNGKIMMLKNEKNNNQNELICDFKV